MRHTRRHSNDKPFQCTQCDKTFSQKINLKQHIRTHTGDKTFQCRQYDKTFTLKENFWDIPELVQVNVFFGHCFFLGGGGCRGCSFCTSLGMFCCSIICVNNRKKTLSYKNMLKSNQCDKTYHKIVINSTSWQETFSFNKKCYISFFHILNKVELDVWYWNKNNFKFKME